MNHDRSEEFERYRRSDRRWKRFHDCVDIATMIILGLWIVGYGALINMGIGH